MSKEKENKPIEYVKYQQGDVVMFKLNDEDFEKYDNRNKSGGNYSMSTYDGNTDTKAVLAFGEVTGHTHRVEMSEMLEEAGVTLHMDMGNEAGKDVPNAFQVNGGSVELQHEEHDTITLPPGNYVVHIVREFNPITRRAQYVAD
tara:strand:- start:27 stop:458 length:432 start_codon:yes stop_codon:yes gene_type:complete